MRIDRTSINALGAVLALGALSACDIGPATGPSYDRASLAAAFSQLAAPESNDGAPVEVGCPAGGHFTFEMATSFEADGDITIRHTQHVRRYVDCGMSRGSAVVVANGELSYTGEAHLESEQAQWPHGVLYETSHQWGVLTMASDGAEPQVCEYDLVQESEPRYGRFSIRGTACGVPRNRDFTIPVS